MLKMYIDNEEVVSNNDFSIKEEILSPSSTILNNVYPKTWEDDKDYTSRFYYPKDYSRFMLEDYTHIPPESGLTTTITNNATIQNVDTTKEQEVTQLDGNTQQTTLSGKNKFNVGVSSNYVNPAHTQARGFVSVSGNVVSFVIQASGDTVAYNDISKFQPNKTYTISATASMSGGRFYVQLRNLSDTGWLTNSDVPSLGTGWTYNSYYQGWFTSPATFEKTITIPNCSYWILGLGFGSTNVGTTQTITNIQVEEGSTKTDYQEYCGGIPSPNPNYPQNINVVTGNQEVEIRANNNLESADTLYQRMYDYNSSQVSQEKDGDIEVIKFSPQYYRPYGTNQLFNCYTGWKPNTQYTIRAKVKYYSGGNQLYLQIAYTDGTQTYTQINYNDNNYHEIKILSTANKTIARAGFSYGTSSIWLLDKSSWYVGEGSQTEYPEYKGNTYEVNLGDIELCKIGDYQDKIYKSGNKWYLHKEIGKVVLNGSEASWYTGSTQGGEVRYEYRNNDFTDQIENTAIGPILSNYFKATSVNQSYTNVIGISYKNKGSKGLYIYDGTNQTLANFKTWLSTHNTIVYYALATSTETEITNEELINQLESIKLISGYNEVSITSGDLPGSLTIHYNFVTEKDIHDIIFNGMVKNTSDISLNPREPKYCSLEVLDYKTLLSEGDTLDFVISNKTILEAINMVVNSVSKYGFELGNVNILNGNDIIGTYSTENMSAYDVLQYLADISGAKWTCRQKDDNSMYIDFYDPTLLPEGKEIEYTTEWACENNLVDLTFNYGTRDYRNKQVIISDEVFADIDYVENKVADSYTRDFILNNPIGTIKEILVNGEEKSVATDTEKDIGVYADFYYKVGDNILSSNDSNPPYEFGNTITIYYIPIIKGREVVQNDDEIDRVSNQLEVNGTIARYEARDDETDTNKLLAIGETYLKYKGEAEITLTLKTLNNDIYQVGQMVYFNAPIQDLAKHYMVKNKEINIIASGEDTTNIFYTYELSSSFNSERAVNWFDNQRSKTAGNIKEGEYISRNIDISGRTKIVWSGCYCEEIEDMTGDNTINATLDAPVIK